MQIASGTMAVNSLITQPNGANSAKYIIPPIKMIMERYIHLKDFAILGTSLKKLEASNSLAVAPQVMLIENMWARMAQLR